MGNSESEYYNESKVNIFIYGNIGLTTNSTIIESIFPDEIYEYKNKLDLVGSKKYIFLSGQLIRDITDNSINRIKQKIRENKNKKNIIVCFSDDEELLKKVKEQLSSLPQEKIPFFVFVKTNQFSQNIVEYRKIKKINVIKYFGQSREDINESNTLKTAEIFKSTILQIEGYYNERGTLYRNYLFGYLNNINNLEHIESNNNIQIEEMMSGARSTLNIFLFGQARAGKSRFINLSMNEKIAYEDYSAGSITTKFTRYELPMNNNNNGELGQIVFYDAPGNNDKNYKEYNKALEQTLD